MILETAAVVISLTAAGSAGVLCHGAKRYFERSVSAFRLSALMANKAEHSKAKAAGHADSATKSSTSVDLMRRAVASMSDQVTELAKSHNDLSRKHVADAQEARDRARLAAEWSLTHANASKAHSDVSEGHAETANTAARTAGTLSVAVTEAAQRAAKKSQKQAECYNCHRAVNSYTLKDDGRVVCKWCSDRNF